MPPTDHARPAVPFAVATGAILLFTTMDAVVKAMPASLPTIQVVAMRFVFGIPLVLAALWWLGAGWPSLSSWKANAPRGVLNVASTLLFFTALRRLPFAEALALSYLGPLILALLAAAMLGERLRASVLGAVLLGLVGVAVIAWDALSDSAGFSADLVGIAAAVGSAFTYALNNALLRRQAQRDHATSIVLIQHIVPSLVALPFALADWHAPAPLVWPVFVLLAAIGVSGHFLLTWAFGRAPAGMLAVVDYLALPYAAALGFLVFGEVPSPAVWLGAALIVAACLIVTRRRA
ncbi:MAG: DMT family transporter [Acetobacteraceae bacterium]|nr:DMT family transporter [Acetobacteraceae bacterium]